VGSRAYNGRNIICIVLFRTCPRQREPGLALADRARQAGATEAEIAAVVEICYVNGGLQRLSVGFEALATDQTSEGDD